VLLRSSNEVHYFDAGSSRMLESSTADGHILVEA